MKVLRTELSSKATDSMRCIYRHVAKGGFYKQGWPRGSRDIIALEGGGTAYADDEVTGDPGSVPHAAENAGVLTYSKKHCIKTR
jgi:hypothetical protein